MTKKPNKNEALEAVDFIINVLKDHEKNLDRLISELAGKFGQLGEVPNKIARVEERLKSLQAEVSSLKGLSSPKDVRPSFWLGLKRAFKQMVRRHYMLVRGPPIIMRCKQWDDFKVLASHAETVLFLFKEAEKSFQADALKEGRVLIYSGDFPRDAKLVKFWLARELNVSEDKVFEGALCPVKPEENNLLS